jgi:hypothetical protein
MMNKNAQELAEMEAFDAILISTAKPSEQFSFDVDQTDFV